MILDKTVPMMDRDIARGNLKTLIREQGGEVPLESLDAENPFCCA